MTENQKKALTLFLGRTWHTYKGNGEIECSCGYIPWHDNKLAGADVLELTAHFKRNNSCTFTTWQDLGDVKEKLAEEEMWAVFLQFAFNSSAKDEPMSMFSDEDIDAESHFYDEDYIAWLFRPVNEKGEPHFCQLVADFLTLNQKGE